LGRAQRLAASPEKSPSRSGRRPGSLDKCSTPRGITGKIARHRATALHLPVLVLNASRHHRKNRKVEDTTELDADSAQRLAASPEKSPMISLATAVRIFNGAQRLAASPEKSQFRSVAGRTRGRVLNASRHHRKNRALDLVRQNVPRDVLNASRHHRKNRPQQNLCVAFPQACSTPRGITGKIAVYGRRRSVGHPLCSTPRGITGKIAMNFKPKFDHHFSAQRLAASPEKSLPQAL